MGPQLDTQGSDLAEAAAGATLTASAVRDMLGLVVRGDGSVAVDDLLTVAADPHGEYAPRPVMPRSDGLLSRLGRGLRRTDQARGPEAETRELTGCRVTSVCAFIHQRGEGCAVDPLGDEQGLGGELHLGDDDPL